MQKKKPELGKYFALPNPGLRAYFARTETGNPDDYRPPFWKGVPREEVLSRWQKVVDDSRLKERYPSLVDYELEMKSKVGPMSIQLPLKDRHESIENYFTAVTPHCEPISAEAIKAACEFFSKAGGLRPSSREATIARMRLSTNSGSPFFTKRRRAVSMSAKANKYEYCAVLGWRGQEGGIHDDDVKQRVIWMMPLELNIRELAMYQPAIAAIQKYELIPAYVSMDRVDEEITQLFDTKGADDDVICTDFSKFDQHFNPVMQAAAKEIFQSLSTRNSETERWFKEIFPIKFNLPLVCSENLAYFGEHGMGSGSGGTNFDECLAHKALQFEAAQAQKQSLNVHSMAYGDDGILTYPGIKVEDVIRTYTRHGQEMNETKQYVSKHDCVVLRRWHDMDYRDEKGTMVGVYSTFRALGRLLAQERFYDPEIWNDKMVTLRAWSILENCKHHPLFGKFVDFCIEGDKNRLGLALPGGLSDIVSTAKIATEQMPDFLGYTKSNMAKSEGATDITSWSIYRYLASKQAGTNKLSAESVKKGGNSDVV